MTYWVDTLAEWNQIFNDTWRWYRDFFYDANMHGQDWRDVGERYRACIPQLSSRAGLNWLMSQMVGELCVGHAYIGGGDMGGVTLPESPVYTGRLGADLAYDAAAGFFRFARIYGPSEYNLDLKAPLVRPDLQLKEGDYLIAINGRALQKNEDYHRWLQVAKGQKVALTVNSLPVAAGRPHLRGRAAAQRPLAALQPLADRQHPQGAEGDRRPRRLHAHQRHGRGQHRRVRQVLAGLPLQARASSSTCAATRAAGPSIS